MQANESVIASPNDDRQYQYLKLENDLKVLLVHDEKAPYSAASLTINVGHFDDPLKRQGLAHFLEHMLFLGTKKFPRPNEFQDFIHKHGGNNNAWTGSEHTNFFFRINSEYFEQALYRFSQFFIAPTFCDSLVNKERNAIDSEFSLKLKDDIRRIYQVHKETVAPNHPFSKFSVGNKETLAGKPSELSAELVNFFKTHYSANLMTLCFIAPFTFDELATVANKYFAQITNKHLSKQYPAIPLYSNNELNLQINIKSIKKQHKIILCFPFSSPKDLYQTKPFAFISHLLGDEGKGSLLAYLIKLELATQLTAGGGVSGYNFKDYSVTIQLTDKGLNHIDYIIKLFFDYIKLIIAEGVTHWRYKERSDLLSLAFQYQPRSDTLDLASRLSLNMHHYLPQDIIYGDYRADGLDVAQCLSLLKGISPDNLRIQVISPNIETNTFAAWYNTPYKCIAIDKERSIDWQNSTLNKAFFLPKQNEFIPNKLIKDLLPPHNTLINVKSSIKPNYNKRSPQLIATASGYKFWYQQEIEFNAPKGHIFLSLDSENACSNARQAALTRLYVEVLLDNLTEYTYPAEVAGLSYDIYPHQAGISLHISGFTQHQEKLLILIIEQARLRKFDKTNFTLIKNQLLQIWQNSSKAKPISRLFAHLTVVLQKSSYTTDDMALELQTVSYEELLIHIDNFYRKNHLEALIYGDWSEENTKALIEKLTRLLTLVTTPSHELNRELINLKGQGSLVQQVETNHIDNAIIVYYQSESIDIKHKALFCLLNHTMSSAFFYQLRTQKQLGYMLGTGYLPIHQHPGIIFYIQSPAVKPLSLLQAIDEFITDFNYAILQISVADWEANKKGLITQLLEPDTNMKNRSQRYWANIGNKDYLFNHREKMAHQLQKITPKDLIQFIKQKLHPKDADRLILMSKTEEEIPLSIAKNTINDLTEFKLQTPKFALKID